MTTMSMIKCACKRGFFVLRDCGQAAAETCELCRRPVCREHFSNRSGVGCCVECAGRQAQQDSLDRDESWDYSDAGWAYAYRHRYYTRSGYSPFGWGSDSDSFYDSYDVRSFDSSAGASSAGNLVQSDTADDNSPDFSDDADAGFGDS